jgi:DNA-binding transcriptional MerR regulator
MSVVSLKEVQIRLGVPQHVLIHLCEKGVIQPDFAETSGRGKRREFSRRNLFEFGVALALRRFELPVATTGLVVRLLRSLGVALAKAAPGFGWPEDLSGGGIDLDLHLFDGHLLVLAGGTAGLERPLLIGSRIGDVLGGDVAKPRVMRLTELPDHFEARLTLKLGEIARKLLK